MTSWLTLLCFDGRSAAGYSHFRLQRAVPHNETSAYDVAVLGKALAIVESLVEGKTLGVSELSERTGASKASAFRILSTLERRGYVTKDPASRKYRPGPRLVAIACTLVSGLDLVQGARPVLAALHAEFDETVNLGVLSEGQVLYLDILESSHGLRMAARVGKRDPLHSTALGKAILAWLPADETTGLLPQGRFARCTPRTITTRPSLERQLVIFRKLGYAVDDEENEPGARCVGVPILDARGHPVAALSVSGPASRLHDATIRRIGRRLLAAASDVATRMGYGAAAAF